MKFFVDRFSRAQKPNTPQIESWVAGSNIVEVDYPDQTAQILQMIMEKHGRREPAAAGGAPRIAGVEESERLSVRKILAQLAKGR